MANKIRKWGFWALDALKGGNVYKAYREIRKINENPNSDESAEIRERNIERLLRYSSAETEFYSRYSNAKSLSDFPVINKNIIRSNYADFIGKSIKKNSLNKVTTSGSTGTPFTIFQDSSKRTRHAADNIFFNELAGMHLGQKLYYFRIWNDLVYRDWFKNYLQNVVPMEASKLDADTINNEILEKIVSDPGEKALLAYASTYEAIIKAVSETYDEPIDANVVSIMSMSETLPKHIKNKLDYYFSCKAVSRYSNMENGFIGQQSRNGEGEYLINLASYAVEILQFDSDEPVTEGEMGRIVITDLFNYGMPLIRYDTGDIASIIEKDEGGKRMPVFNRIEGRKVDFITDSRGRLISPHIITNSMWKFPEIKQFQFIQNGKNDYTMVINIKKDDGWSEQAVLDELKKYVGTDSAIKVKYVDEVPLLSSGKRKKVVNNYKTE